MFVHQWMTGDPVAVKPSDPVLNAYGLLKEKNIRRAPVVEQGHLAGILTLSDLQDLLLPMPNRPGVGPADCLTVRNVMTRNPLTAAPTDPIERAALIMERNRISSLPVVDAKRLVGIITETDIFKALLRILGGHERGCRAAFQLNGGLSGLQDILDVCIRHDVAVTNLNTLCGLRSDKDLLVLRIRGLETQECLDDLRKLNYPILQVSQEGHTVSAAGRPAGKLTCA